MSTMLKYNFNDNLPKKLKNIKYGTNWPVVYIIYNAKDAYIGETTDVSIRTNQHLANELKRSLKKISIITDEKFNKSSILDLESFLIQYMSSDNKFNLLNGNRGLVNHNYYQKKMYEKIFKEIWLELQKEKIVQNDLRFIENTDLFKYSPYKSLTTDQYMAVNDILSTLAEDVKHNRKSIFLVNGGAGTGKTVLGIYLVKLLSQIKDSNQIEIEEDQVEQNLSDILKINEAIDELKIGLVIPMENLRKTLKKVFKEINGLKPNMVLSPNEVAKSEEIYDLLIVDEAHRLRRRKNLPKYGPFDLNNSKLGLGKEGTELDWILLKSKYQILFYDENQSIKTTDVRKEDFNQLMLKENYHEYKLETQLRCMLGGNEYIDYVKAVFSNNPPKQKIKFKEYDFKIFDNVNDMVEAIKIKNDEVGLCRNIAGIGFPWKFKNKSKEYDIKIDEYKYIWNTKTTDWINSKNSINEIGCIHTSQGFDLNYTGLIIGYELDYNPINKEIFVDRDKYCDTKGKAATSEEELLEYVLNIYRTMCTRGIKGTYLYICNDNLREYLKKYVDTI